MARDGLFNRLLDLHSRFPGRVPEEDFFTELIAYLFETCDSVLLAWLETLGWKKMAEYDQILVETQVDYERLPEQVSGSRPDFTIVLRTESYEDLVLIESKLGAQEGNQQLKRYAEILENDRSARQRWLIYITRENDPKDSSNVYPKTNGTGVVFKQTRWRDFYRFLKNQPQDFLIEEVLKFMKGNGMEDSEIHFTAADLSSMANLHHVFHFLYSVLDNSIQRKYLSVVCSKPRLSPDSLRYDWARFALESSIVQEDWMMGCVLGFDSLAQGFNGDPELKIFLYLFPVNKGSKNLELRKKLNDFMYQTSVERPDWKTSGLNDLRRYTMLKKSRKLRELLGSEDIVSECKNVLMGYLDELAEIKSKNPEIPWKVLA